MRFWLLRACRTIAWNASSSLLLTLKKICNHPTAVINNHTMGMLGSCISHGSNHNLLRVLYMYTLSVKCCASVTYVAVVGGDVLHLSWQSSLRQVISSKWQHDVLCKIGTTCLFTQIVNVLAAAMVTQFFTEFHSWQRAETSPPWRNAFVLSQGISAFKFPRCNGQFWIEVDVLTLKRAAAKTQQLLQSTSLCCLQGRDMHNSWCVLLTHTAGSAVPTMKRQSLKTARATLSTSQGQSISLVMHSPVIDWCTRKKR